jgi:two-component system, OmpR family, phosphate regulon sensor histidine kinase PhoR
MPGLLPRALIAGAMLLAGMALGTLVGLVLHNGWLGTALGALVVLVLVLLRHIWHGGRLLAWLRGNLQGSAPRDEGFWGELGYRIEKALRQKDHLLLGEAQRLEHFLAAIEASPNGVLLLDAGDQIEWCNSVAAQHFGLDPVRDRRQRVTNLVRSPAFVAYLQEASFEEAVVFVGPQPRSTLSVLVRPYGDGQKLVLSQDITEKERADAMRRDFVANVSHEIRTPLTVLAGFVETMAQLPLTDIERRRVLTLMEQQTNRMQTLVGDLLTLAQLEGSPRPAGDRWLPLAGLLQRALADAVALSAGRHRIELSAAGEGVEIAGSEPELFSAVSNLLGNAVRYTPEGGLVQLHWRWREDGAGEIEVRDSGIGIAREHIPRLTERFYRVDGSRSRDTGGTGLGLSIVKHVVQRHGGEIDITSEPGKGSSFRLVLPAVRLRTRAAEVGADSVDGDGAAPRAVNA